jgi:UDP-galactopyranose mutase
MKQLAPILVVGAGVAGVAIARELAEHDRQVVVIDRRAHIGGTAYDKVMSAGVRVHQYGPHLLHTSNERVITWLSRFGSFVNYEHRVRVELPDGRSVPFPINRETVNEIFGTRFSSSEEIRRFIGGQVERNIDAGKNAATFLLGTIGPTLTNFFFRPYSQKMWGVALEDLDISVVRRVPIRFDDDDRYFASERYQLLPQDGYAALFQRILDHPSIRVLLRQTFDAAMLREYAHCFNSMAIDEYFGYCEGELPYRSVRFHHRNEARCSSGIGVAVVNVPGSGRFTRKTDWSVFPCHLVTDGPQKTITLEEPCDSRDNEMERYYPMRTCDPWPQELYRRYRILAEEEHRVTFIGRCGTYQYLDMHQVLNQSIQTAQSWLRMKV